MIWTNQGIPGLYLLSLEKMVDSRGYFARTWCNDEAMSHVPGFQGFTQNSVSFNSKAGTLRGMHFQTIIPENKLVTVLTGKIFDVVVDLRKSSPTYLKHCSFELRAEDRTSLFIPRGCGHGFQTLEDNTLISYQMDVNYSPEHSKTFKYNDSRFNISWPIEEIIISDKDLNSIGFTESIHSFET